MKVKSPAKLNLHLEVIKKRTDGFHELRTVFQLIDLCDEIEFKFANKEIDLIESPFPIKDNLILKAAHLLKKITQTSQGATIILEKKNTYGKRSWRWKFKRSYYINSSK